jgi:urease accessory protein
MLRLLHLVSPSLPIGAFTYSQGIEWAVENGWIGTAADLESWLRDQVHNPLATLDLPLLARMHAAASAGDIDGMVRWIDWLAAGRETSELRAEEANRGRALVQLLVAWHLLDDGENGASQSPRPPSKTRLPLEKGYGERKSRKCDSGLSPWRPVLARSQTAGFAFAAALWGIDPRDAALGYVWSWLENLVLAAVKLVPLGQTQGQEVIARLILDIPALVERALKLEEEEIGASSPALAIASSAHETQYTRLYRS